MTKLVWGFGKMPDGVSLLAIDDFFGAFSVAMGLLPSTYLFSDVVVDDAPRRLRLCFGICNLLTYDAAIPLLNSVFQISLVFVQRYTLTR